jgi:hypothetical protein
MLLVMEAAKGMLYRLPYQDRLSWVLRSFPAVGIMHNINTKTVYLLSDNR